MKRLLALAALALAASACSTTTNTNTGAGNTNANANTAAASPTPAGPTQADIEAKERQILDALKAKNWDAFAGLLADDFTLVSTDGLATKAETLDAVKKYDLTEYTFSEPRFLKIDTDLAVITYTISEKSSYDGQPMSDKPYRASTAWVNRGGTLLAVFHQETQVREAPAGQGGNANANGAAGAANGNANRAGANANASASPGASPVTPTTPTDAEKAVWDALKRRDYDAFADFLLPDSLEVEPDKVYTKSESVEAVKRFDFSKWAISDFKEVRIVTDAALVTYVVKGPLAGRTVTGRHSTIWSRRASQWKAAFHQGTPQEAPGR